MRLLVEDHRLAGEPLVLPEPVQDRAHRCLVGRVASGEFCGLQRGAVGDGTVLTVATEFLLASARTGLAAGEQDAGHLGVHVAKGEVQIAGGENLRAGVMPDDAQTVSRVPDGDVGDDIEPADRQHRDGGERADAPRRGLQPQPAQAAGRPPPARLPGRRGRSRDKHPSVSTLTSTFHKRLPLAARPVPELRGYLPSLAYACETRALEVAAGPACHRAALAWLACPQDGAGECGAISMSRVPNVTEVSGADPRDSGARVCPPPTR